MKALLTAIKSALQNASALSYVADADIFITPDEDLLPVNCGFPAIGLKDGAVSREEADFDARWITSMDPGIIVYQLLTDGEPPVMGQTSPAIKGVLDICADIRGVLENNALSISGMQFARCYAESPAEVLAAEDLAVIKRRMNWTYRKEEDMA